MPRRHLCWCGLFCLFFSLVAIEALGADLKNPYHKSVQWKLWLLDPSPVKIAEDKIISLPPPEKRLYPDDADDKKHPGRFLAYRDQDWPGRKYAGFWMDAYSSRDRGHSYIGNTWSGRDGNSVSIRDSLIHLIGGPIHQLGVNFTSQSTTGMGHDLANNERSMRQLEENFYFADVLVSGPAHVSYMDRTIKGSTDAYQALAPIFHNSVGSSGSEQLALTKMVIAGGYLPKLLKPLLKLHGLYPSTILYLWKAGLPFKVPYDHELRHRVAYNSNGDRADFQGGNQMDANELVHQYDDTAHLRNMVDLAKNMTAAPPICLLRTLGITGGRPVYALKTTLLVQQNKFEPVRIRVSTEDSYDLQDLPLTFRWKVLYGNKNTQVRQEGPTVYTITVPYSSQMPKGRTSILLIANNGRTDSNPAVINVYRTEGADNLRPALIGLKDLAVLPGEKVELDLTGIDPEGFPVSFYQRAGEVGSLDGSRFIWTCPPDHPPGTETVTIIASDGTCGNSYNAEQTTIQVTPTVAVLSADTIQGQAPLTVAFSSAGSRDRQEGPPAGRAGPLTYIWDFDDGETSTEPNPRHEFADPGFYDVSLTVKGPSGSHTVRGFIHVEHRWPLVLSNGWAADKIDERVWLNQTPEKQITTRGDMLIVQGQEQKGGFRITSLRDFSPPFFLEAVFTLLEKSGKGTGFRVLGAQIGYPALSEGEAWDINIAAPRQEGHQWDSLTIGRNVRFPWCRARLRMYVQPDPHNPGKIRFTGWLDSPKGTRFFKFDNRPALDDKLAIFSVDLGSKARFEVHRFQVWTPPAGGSGRETKAGPGAPMSGQADKDVCPCDLTERSSKTIRITPKKINVEGNGLNIPNGAKEPNPTDHTDFGPVPPGDTKVRTFTIQNLGTRDLNLAGSPPYLEISGKNSRDFSVVKAPRPNLPRFGSTIFQVKFQPTAKGFRSARVVIRYGEKGQEIYSFQIRGGRPEVPVWTAKDTSGPVRK